MSRLWHVGRALLAALAPLAALLWAAARPLRAAQGGEAVLPPPGLPPGRVVVVPGRGEFFIREAPGPPVAPTVVLLHGWMYPMDATWFACYAAVATRASVLALDLAGHGRGPRPARPFRLADTADDVAALLWHLEIPRAIAVGYSMGGPVAQLLARRHPTLVSGLVLCATSATFSATLADRLLWRGMGVLQIALRLLPRYRWQRLVQAQSQGRLPLRVTRMIDTATPQSVVDLIPWLVTELDRGSPEDVAEAGRELGRYDAREWLDQVAVPTAVVVTARDRLVSPHRQRELARQMPRTAVFEVTLDHNAVVAGAEDFRPVLLAAIDHVIGATPTA